MLLRSKTDFKSNLKPRKMYSTDYIIPTLCLRRNVPSKVLKESVKLIAEVQIQWDDYDVTFDQVTFAFTVSVLFKKTHVVKKKEKKIA